MKEREIAVIGVGKFGREVIRNLSKNRKNYIVAIDSKEESIKLSEGHDISYIGPLGEDRFLRELNLDTIDIFVVGIGEDIETSLLTCSYLINEFPKSRVIAKASTERHEKILESIGISEIINIEKEAAKKSSFRIMNPYFRSEALKSSDITEIGDDFVSLKVKVPAELLNVKVSDLQLRELENINIPIFERKGKIDIVTGNTKFLKGDEFFIIGKNKRVTDFLKATQK